jgi:undecaprenyl-diphosphatase
MRLDVRLGTTGLLAVLLLVPVALLAAFVAGDWAPLHHLDAAATDALHSWARQHPGWTRAAVWWTTVFSPTGQRLATLALVIWLSRRHAYRLVQWVVITMVVGGVLGAVLKLLVGRHRPDLLDPVARASGFAFPSGHALNAALAAGVFVLVLLPLVRPGRRWLLWTAAVVGTVLTGLTRIVIGVHWTSDVVAGWLLGAAVVAATAAAFSRRPSRNVVAAGLAPNLARPDNTGG